MGKVKAHELVAGIEHCKEHCRIGLRTAMWLNVHPLGIIKFLEALARNILNDIHYLATAIVALAGIALGIFVC